MAVLHCFSADTQVVPSSAGGNGAASTATDRKWVDNVQTNVWTVDTTTFKNGTASLKAPAASAGVTTMQYNLNNLTTCTMACWMRFSAVPAATFTVNRAAGAVTNFSNLYGLDGVFYAGVGTLDGTQTTLFTPLVNTWYWVSLSVDVSANPNVTTTKVYNSGGLLVASGTYSKAAAADVISTFRVGNGGTVGVDQWVDDIVVTDSSTPLAPQVVTLLRATGNGTSSFTDNDFQNQAAGNLTTASDFSALVNQLPPAMTTFVQQAVIRTTGYFEVTFADLPSSGIGTPTFVQLMAAAHPVGALTANTSMMRLNDNATITAEAIADWSVASNTLEYHKHCYATAPSTSGAWSAALVNGLKARYGFSDDVTPHPALDAFYLEVVAPQTFTATSGKKGAATGKALGNRIGILI